MTHGPATAAQARDFDRLAFQLFLGQLRKRCHMP